MPDKVMGWIPVIGQEGLGQQEDETGESGQSRQPPGHQPKDEEGQSFLGKAAHSKPELIHSAHKEVEADQTCGKQAAQEDAE